MALFNHNLSQIVSALDEKIAALQEKQTQIKEALARSASPTINSVALQQVSESLAAAQVARAGLDDSCCGTQNCDITWSDI